jgi:hypothetical protein
MYLIGQKRIKYTGILKTAEVLCGLEIVENRWKSLATLNTNLQGMSQK